MSSQLKKPSLFLIRHAQTKVNILVKEAAENKLPVQSYKFAEDLIDVGITRQGELNTQKVAQQMADKDVKAVLVSPFRRCLQTASLIFKEHKSEPKFIAVPQLRSLFQAASEIPLNLNEIRAQFNHIDFSRMENYDPDHWVFDTLACPQEKDKLLKLVKDRINDKQDFASTFRLQLANELRNNWPYNFETKWDLVNRVKEAKEISKQIQEEVKGNICIVSHLGFVTSFVAEKFGDDGSALNVPHHDNGQILELQL